MLDAGCEPNIYILTLLIQCYGKAGRMDDVVRTFDQVLDLGIEPDARFVGSLLNVMTQALEEEIGKLATCIAKANPKLGYAVNLLLNEENREGEMFRKHACDLLESIGTDWSLHVKNLSLGALTALHIWMNDLLQAIESGEELPELLGINTGHGKHKFSEKGLAGAFELHLKELNAPFHEVTDKVGWFLTTKVAAVSWMESRRSREAALASSGV